MSNPVAASLLRRSVAFLLRKLHSHASFSQTTHSVYFIRVNFTVDAQVLCPPSKNHRASFLGCVQYFSGPHDHCCPIDTHSTCEAARSCWIRGAHE